jgi:hypothetical protein
VPVATISPASPPPFASTPQQSVSGPLTLTPTNSGERSLAISGLSFAGADGGDFLVGADTCIGAIAPRLSCQLRVYFAPEGQGQRTATLLITSNDYANSPLHIALSGTGTVPQQGPPGPTGPQGPQGPPTGPQGTGGRPDRKDPPARPGRPAPQALPARSSAGTPRRPSCSARSSSRPVATRSRKRARDVRYSITRRHRTYAHGFLRVRHGRAPSEACRASAAAPTDQPRSGRFRIAIGERHSQRRLGSRPFAAVNSPRLGFPLWSVYAAVTSWE